MRILHIHTINRVANLYAGALAALGYQSTINQPSMIGAGSVLPIKLALMPARVFDLRHVIGQMNAKHFDLVHIHWAAYGTLGLMARVPFIVQCHGSDVRQRLHSPFFRAWLAPVFHRAAAVLCITPDLLAPVRTIRPDTLFLPAPIDTNHFTPDATPPASTSTRPWTILLFSRLDPGKGVAASTAGISRFASRHPEVRVILLDYGILSRAYRTRFGDRFEFLPPVAPNQVVDLLRLADVVVGQLAVGALGLSELQAMSCAKPVIASFRYPDAYPDPPPLFEAADADAVEARLEELYRAPEEGRAAGAQARAWVQRYHDPQVLAARLDTLYQHVINHRPARAMWQ